jgi:hypothetical protein
MIFNTTYNNKDFTFFSRDIVGKPFSFFQKIKMNGVGSGRFMIANVSEKLKINKIQFSEIDYGNIELRPKGIIVHFTNRLQRFSWVIPYYKLITYNTKFFSIYSDENYIHFLKNKNYKENKNFIDKMRNMKIKELNLGYYDS